MSDIYQGKFTGRELDDTLSDAKEVLERLPDIETNVALLTPQEVTEEEFEAMIEDGTWVEGQIYFTSE